MQLSIDLDSSNALSLQSQIFESIRLQILTGRLKPDTLLPSTRLLCDQLNVSRNTVVLAYDHLIAEDYIYSRGTSGTYVSAQLPENSLSLNIENEYINVIENNFLEHNPVVFKGRCQDLDNSGTNGLDIDFKMGCPDPESFPDKKWRQLMLRKLRNAGSDMAEYHDPAGIPDLRQAIASHLLPARGMKVEPEQVIIVNGSQEALNVVSRLLIEKGTRVVIENPCYQGAVYTFESYGANILPVNVDSEGLNIKELPETSVNMVYVTPSHQYPIGGTLSLSRRKSLLAWAREAGAYIVEDDYDSDFRHHSSPLTSLAGHDPYGSVIYISTFSKSIGAGLRMGYMVVPKQLLIPAITIKTLMGNGNAWLEQSVLAEFISSNTYTKHLRRIRHIYVNRRDCLIASLRKHFGHVVLSGLEGGTHLTWHLPDAFPDATRMKHLAENVGVGIYTIDSAAAYESGQTKYRDRTVILGYASVTEDEICKGISRLAAVPEIRHMLNNHIL